MVNPKSRSTLTSPVDGVLYPESDWKTIHPEIDSNPRFERVSVDHYATLIGLSNYINFQAFIFINIISQRVQLLFTS